MTRSNIAIDQHPDIAELRARYDQVAETSTAQSVDGLTALSGLFLAASPWIVGFRPIEHDLAINNVFFGIAVALLGVGFATTYGRTHGLAWAPVVIGIWTILAPWVVQGRQVAGGTVTTNVITGILITLLGLTTMGMGIKRSESRR
jgi:hypothetical protein